MRFKGEIKFPEIDHPGVPVTFVVEGTQAELVLDGESLGRWSLYDIHARRLISSAFQIDLDGTEITFVAADPIDFAYRGVEHMAKTWAEIKARPFARRKLAVNKSRRGVIPSRVDELQEAMQTNLATQAPRRLSGQPVMDSPQIETKDVEKPPIPPVIGVTDGERARMVEELRALEEEKARIAEERQKLQEELSAAEERETVRVEAYRLEMKRLETEIEQAKRHGALAGDLSSEELGRGPEPEPIEAAEPEPEPIEAAEPEPEPEPIEAAEPEPIEAAEPEPEPEPIETAEPEPEPEPIEAAEPEPEPEPIEAAEPEPEPEPIEAAEPEPEPALLNVLDLSNLEEGHEQPPAAASAPVVQPPPTPEPEPALAGAPRDRSGLMGAVRAAFARNGGKTHEHHFLEAPGGIGITRFVCDDCGYVSIAVSDD